MSEHKFKVGDVVQTKPMSVEVVELLEHGGVQLKVRTEHKHVDWLDGRDVEPLPATDAELVEKLLLEAYVQIVRLEPYAPVAPENVLGVAKTRMQIALHCAGYTRSPKPDVNQMMMDALKISDEVKVSPRTGYYSDWEHDTLIITGINVNRTTQEIEYTTRIKGDPLTDGYTDGWKEGDLVRVAIAAGSEL